MATALSLPKSNRLSDVRQHHGRIPGAIGGNLIEPPLHSAGMRLF